MSLGGGSFTSQNKVLPGTYINFVSSAKVDSDISKRGYCTMPLNLDWGEEDTVITVSKDSFYTDSFKLFGYLATDAKMKPLREIFMNASVLYLYRLNGGGIKASNTYATAKYSGIRGNDLKIVIQTNVDDSDKKDVLTYLGTILVDTQTVSSAADLVSNDYVDFDTTATLSTTNGTSLSSGTNSTVTGTNYSNYFDAIESYSFNIMGIASTDDTIKSLAVNFCKRLRDELGVKFQLVVYDYVSADYIGVISIANKCTDGMTVSDNTETYPNESALVYWVTGAESSADVSTSVQNQIYDGEYTVDADYTQNELSSAISAGEFILHKQNNDIRVLADVNTLTTTTETLTDIYKSNQTIRIIDRLANDDAAIFTNKYLGKIQNNEAGRSALWLDLLKVRQDLQKSNAIDTFDESSLVISKGQTNDSVVISNVVTIISSMSKLYITTTVI